MLRGELRRYTGAERVTIENDVIRRRRVSLLEKCERRPSVEHPTLDGGVAASPDRGIVEWRRGDIFDG